MLYHLKTVDIFYKNQYFVLCHPKYYWFYNIHVISAYKKTIPFFLPTHILLFPKRSNPVLIDSNLGDLGVSDEIIFNTPQIPEVDHRRYQLLKIVGEKAAPPGHSHTVMRA